MSKNVNSTAFRKIDVDQYNDDFKDDENATEIPSLSNGNNFVDEQEVNQLIRSGSIIDALRYLIGIFTAAYKNPVAKEAILTHILHIISIVKTNEVEKIVEALTDDELDVMMKYIYRGFEHASTGNCNNLFVWHDKVFKKAGVGSIVRVLTDKKRV